MREVGPFAMSCHIYLLHGCVSELNLIGQLEGNISPYCPLIIARAYRDASYCPCLGSGSTAILDLCIVPPFGRADTVDLKRNISLYFPPSRAIMYIYSILHILTIVFPDMRSFYFVFENSNLLSYIHTKISRNELARL